MVSFLHLSAYIRDEEIEEKLKGMNIQMLTPIYRRYYKGTKLQTVRGMYVLNSRLKLKVCLTQ